jgi:hypothetical protein
MTSPAVAALPWGMSTRCRCKLARLLGCTPAVVYACCTVNYRSALRQLVHVNDQVADEKRWAKAKAAAARGVPLFGRSLTVTVTRSVRCDIPPERQGTLQSCCSLVVLPLLHHVDA